MKKVVFFINSLAGGGAERILTTIIADLESKFLVTLVLMEDRIDYEISNKLLRFFKFLKDSLNIVEAKLGIQDKLGFCEDFTLK